jgi:hypothetical protein
VADAAAAGVEVTVTENTTGGELAPLPGLRRPLTTDPEAKAREEQHVSTEAVE